MRAIYKGDVVTVVLLFNNHFTFQLGPRIPNCEILHTPANSGDMWHFKEKQHGNIFAINPQASSFLGLQLYKEADNDKNDQ